MYIYLQKVISRKLLKKLIFCWHLGKVNDENSRIRIHLSEAWIQIRIRPLLFFRPQGGGGSMALKIPTCILKNIFFFSAKFHRFFSS